MFVYEVQIEIDELLVARLKKYMVERHIPDVLASGYFQAAAFSTCGDSFSVEYTASESSQIDEYVEKASGPLRQDFLDHFPTGARISRKIWEVEAVFQAPQLG